MLTIKFGCWELADRLQIDQVLTSLGVLPFPARLLLLQPAERVLHICTGLTAYATFVQDVPRSTDHAPSKTFYTFRANTDGAFRVMQHDIVQALLNLRLRHKHERNKAEDVRFLGV